LALTLTTPVHDSPPHWSCHQNFSLCIILEPTARDCVAGQVVSALFSSFSTFHILLHAFECTTHSFSFFPHILPSFNAFSTILEPTSFAFCKRHHYWISPASKPCRRSFHIVIARIASPYRPSCSLRQGL